MSYLGFSSSPYSICIAVMVLLRYVRCEDLTKRSDGGASRGRVTDTTIAIVDGFVLPS